MIERTLEGVMADRGVSKVELADRIHMARSTLIRKMQSGNFTVRDIRLICRFLRLDDPMLVYDIFLREPSHNETSG